MSELRSGQRHNRPTKSLSTTAGLLFASLSLVACANSVSSSAESTPSQSDTPVATASATGEAIPAYDCTLGSPITGSVESTKDSIGVQVGSGQYTAEIPEVTVNWGDGKTSEEKPYYTSDDIYHTYSAGHFMVTVAMRVPGYAKSIDCGGSFSVTVNPGLPPMQSVTVGQ